MVDIRWMCNFLEERRCMGCLFDVGLILKAEGGR